MSESVCLLCFSFAKVIKDIKYTRLQSVFETLTDIQIQDESYPLCYICYAKLLKCQQLIKTLHQQDIESQPVRPLVQLCVFNTDTICSLPNNNVEAECHPNINTDCIKREYTENGTRSFEIEIDIKEGNSSPHQHEDGQRTHENVFMKMFCHPGSEKNMSDYHERQKRTNNPFDDAKIEKERSRKNSEKCKRYRENKKNKVALPNRGSCLNDKRLEEKRLKNREKARRYREKKRRENQLALSMAAADSSSGSSATKIVQAKGKKTDKCQSTGYDGSIDLDATMGQETKLKNREKFRKYRENKRKKNDLDIPVLSVGNADSSAMRTEHAMGTQSTERIYIKQECMEDTSDSNKIKILDIKEKHIKQEHVQNIPRSCEIEIYIKQEYIEEEHIEPSNADHCKIEIVAEPVKKKTPERTQDDNKPYTCHVCNKKFTHHCRLKVHEVVHADVKPYKCDICEKSFTQIGNLKMHKSSLHSGEKTFACDICGKRFARLNSLKRHNVLHTGDQPYSCDMCTRKFSHSSSLRTHKLTHSDEKLYTCDECGEKFTYLTMLKRHKLLHADDNPYDCNLCGEKFSHFKAFKTHLFRHRGKKMYGCDVCYKQFLSRANLTQHKKIHLDDNPHSCDVCSKVFSRSDHLRRHRLTHKHTRLQVP